MHHIKAAVTAQTGKHRQGKGFSPDEVKEAGLSALDARHLAIPIDRKRKTSHEENIETLKAHMEKAPKEEAAVSKEKKSKN